MRRRQLPVHAPITPLALRQAAGAGLGLGADALAALSRRLAREYRADHVVLCRSGTEALQLALRIALRRAGGSTLALPAFTCFDVAAAAVAVGATIELYDVEPATLGPDIDSLGQVVGRGVRAVVVAPLYGVPVDWDVITAVLGPHGAVVVEDAAQGHGALWRGQRLGALASISVLSFGRGKGWTGGGGGALLLRGPGWEDGVGDPPAVSSAADEVAALYRAAAQWALGRPGLYAVPATLPWLRLGETVYRDAASPRTMPRTVAAAIEAVAEVAEREAATRRANAQALLVAIEDAVPAVAPVRVHANATAGFLRLPVQLGLGLGGFPSVAEARRLGIVPSYPSTLAALPQVRPALSSVGSWPGAEVLARGLGTLPTHSLVTREEREAIIAQVRRYGQARSAPHARGESLAPARPGHGHGRDEQG